MNLEQRFHAQEFANGYRLVDGVAMHEENPENFLIPHPVLKKHVSVGHYIEVRIDSPRFSVHDGAAEKCYCSTCNGEMTTISPNPVCTICVEATMSTSMKTTSSRSMAVTVKKSC